MEMKIKVA